MLRFWNVSLLSPRMGGFNAITAHCDYEKALAIALRILTGAAELIGACPARLTHTSQSYRTKVVLVVRTQPARAGDIKGVWSFSPGLKSLEGHEKPASILAIGHGQGAPAGYSP